MQSLSDDESLRAENTALRVQNDTLQREFDTLKEQLLALRAELDGRPAGGIPKSAGPAKADDRQAASPPDGVAADRAPGSFAPPPPSPPPPPRAAPRHGLSRAQAERYSRHLLLPAFGVAAQERVCRGSVLVVGCGGLGSPVAMYLAAAGVGRLGLVDHDAVDVTNLHRQVMHATGRVGMPKAESGRLTCAAINPTIQVEAHTVGFSPATALPLVDSYDVVVDCSDNPATRYLVSDACVVAGKPLVSAAAVGTDGQLTVYNYGEDGPCYRCLFPESPAPENCSRCGEAGVLGIVPGIMGCLQALEAIKVLSGVGQVSSKKLTIFDALAGRFTTVKLRGRVPSCAACGPSPAICRTSLPSYDYVAFTGQPPDDGPPQELRLIDPRVRLAPAEVAQLLAAEAQVLTAATAAATMAAAAPTAAGVEVQEPAAAPPPPRTVFLDVRPQTQYDVFALPGVVHIPYERLDERLPELLAMCGAGAGMSAAAAAAAPCSAAAAECSGTPSAGCGCGDTGVGGDGSLLASPVSQAGSQEGESSSAGPLENGNGAEPPRLVVLCRRGNNSQRVAARLAVMGLTGVTDMRGGYQAWAREVDPAAPLL